MRKPQAKAPAAGRKQKRKPLGRVIWLETARQAFVEEGTAGVEINKLAKRLGVSRGGFYWFFKSREQLLDELLSYWAQTSSVQFERILKTNPRDGTLAYRALIDLWVDESDYDPKWDAAVRDWARTSTAVLKVVQAVDTKRLVVLERIFRNMGYRSKEANIRARITYYHQVGYYALGVRESKAERQRLLPFYARVLAGKHL